MVFNMVLSDRIISSGDDSYIELFPISNFYKKCILLECKEVNKNKVNVLLNKTEVISLISELNKIVSVLK